LQKLKRFLAFFTGHSSDDGAGVEDADARAAEFSTLVVDVLLRVCPSPPAANKWTKLSPALDHFALGTLLRLWPSLYQSGFDTLKAKAGSSAVARSGDHSVHDAQVEWHRVNGIRMKETLEFHVCGDRSARLIILTISTEPLRYLTSFFLKCSRDEKSVSALPDLCTVLSRSASPLVTCQQYIGALLCESPHPTSRAQLLSHYMHCSGPDQLASCHPTTSKLARRALLALGSWIWRKHTLPLSEFPFRFGQLLCDDRISNEERRAAELEWDAACACCLRPGMEDRMKQAGIASSDLRTPMWQSIIWWFCQAVTMTTADVEDCRRNGRNMPRSAMNDGGTLGRLLLQISASSHTPT
jgi:hypothetical protein